MWLCGRGIVAEEMQKENVQLREQVAQLKKAERVWAKQRAVLLHNLAALYRTAKVEVSRRSGTDGGGGGDGDGGEGGGRCGGDGNRGGAAIEEHVEGRGEQRTHL